MSGWDESVWPRQYEAPDGEVGVRQCPSGKYEAAVWAPCHSCGKVPLYTCIQPTEELARMMAEFKVRNGLCKACADDMLRRNDLCPECHRNGYHHAGRCLQTPPLPPELLAKWKAEREAEMEAP